MRLPRLIDPTVTIEDDRGERHTYDTAKRFASPELRKRLGRIARQSQRVRWSKPLRARHIVEILFAVGMIGLVAAVSTLVLPRWSSFVVYPMIGMMGGYCAVRWAVMTQRDRIVDAFKRHDRCACCGYALTALPADPDGLTICPECGAAWKLSSGGTALPSRE